MNTKYIFVTGGVVSGLGKGITAASLGTLLKARGFTVTIQKFDPYINIDPGTMNPQQHGEVFVTEDGAETDLDIGHYERFIDENLNKLSNITAGKIYQSVIKKERDGKFLGETVQVIPHITNEIKRCILREHEKIKADIIITEIGGTVGDIESLPFIESIRQVKTDIGSENVLYIHVTLIPFISSSEEIKTKPTQHSVKELMQIGVVPDIIVCRTSKHLLEEHKSKIALFCNIPKENVFENYDRASIYEVPSMLEEQGLSEIVLKRLAIEPPPINLKEWEGLVEKEAKIRKRDAQTIRIALVGKYVAMKDAYLSVSESLRHAAIENGVNIKIDWILADTLEEKEDAINILEKVNAILIPGGFGARGTEGKIKAIKYARENKIPLLGICLGMQLMAIEYARNVLGLKDANSVEFAEDTKNPVVSLMEEQKKAILKGGTMRLGSYTCKIKDNTLAKKIYKDETISERHRHRYEINSDYYSAFEKAGLIISGVLENGILAEIAEIKKHPFMIGVQFHPELKSRPNRAHPLFVNFVQAAVQNIKVESAK